MYFNRRPKPMTFRHMRIFLEVYDCLNMTKAAENLNMTQPGVTKAIKEIEDSYGIRLFERLNKGLYPTKMAESIYFQVRSVTSSFENLEKRLSGENSTRVIRIGGTSTIATFILPKFAGLLKQTRPNLEVRVVVENVAALEHMLSRNIIDLAYVEGMVYGRDLSFKEIIEDRLIAVVSPESNLGNGIKLEELAQNPMLLTEDGSITRRYVDSVFTSRGIRMNPIWESESYHAIINAVHENLGFSILPERLVSNSLASGWIRKIDVTDADFSMFDHIVWHKDKYISPLMRELIDFDYRGLFGDIKYGL